MTRWARASTGSVLLALLAAIPVAGQEPMPPLVVPAGAAPVVDGKVGGDEWKDAVTFDLQRAGESFGHVRLRRSGRQLYVAFEGRLSPWGLGVRLDFTDPVSGRSNLVLVTPVDPPRPPLVPFRKLVGRDAERLSPAACDIRFDFSLPDRFTSEMRLPLDLLEIAPTDKEYGLQFEVWALAENRPIVIWPPVENGMPGVLRSEGAWGAEEKEKVAPPRNEALALLEEADAMSEEGPAFRSAAGWIDGKRKDAPLAELEERAGKIAETSPDMISVGALLMQARLARNDLAGALKALDALDAYLPLLARSERHVLVRMQLLRDLGRYDEALAALSAHEELAESPTIRRERVVLEGMREAWRAEQEIRQAEAKRDDLPRVLLKTGKGDILIELFEDDAPNAVAAFVSLAESGFYDGTRFHWVEGGGRVVGGDPDSKDDDPHNDGFGGPGYRIESEPGRRLLYPMTVSLADTRRERRTEGSAFAIHIAAAPAEDGVNTVLGRVIRGEEVVRKLEHYDRIEKASVVRKRPHPYTPVKR